MDLKEKLLSTNMFLDNEQLNKYVKLILDGLSKDYCNKYTERHHIIPRKYFKLTNKKIDNSKDNIVKLSYYDHILAHYYLSFCTLGDLNKASIIAFITLVDTGINILSKKEKEAILAIKEFSLLKEQSKLINQKHCSNIGKIKTKAHKEALSKARDLHSTTKGKKAIYNKELDKVKFIFEEEINKYLAEGWILGSKPLTEEAKKKISKGNSIALKGKKHQPIAENKLNSGLEFNKVICIETGQIFENIKLAKQWLYETVGIEGGQIKNCCAGQRETTGGYHWQYYKGD